MGVPDRFNGLCIINNKFPYIIIYEDLFKANATVIIRGGEIFPHSVNFVDEFMVKKEEFLPMKDNILPARVLKDMLKKNYALWI